uniref:Coiled-coil domain-containing protein 83 n=1 Tax=Chrysolophus pictus TaxID=9089 RepID=A0A8C3LZM5_CHRPC
YFEDHSFLIFFFLSALPSPHFRSNIQQKYIKKHGREGETRRAKCRRINFPGSLTRISNDNLKEEQEAHIRRILRRIEEKEQEKDAKEVVTRDDVEGSLKDKWQYAKDKEQILKDLLFQTEETDQRLSVRQSERDYWLEYKNVGSRTDANKIKNLKKDIKEVKDEFQRSSEYYKNALKAMKEENDTLVEMNMKKNKEQAPENAVRYLDKNSCREIEENEWLKEEVRGSLVFSLSEQLRFEIQRRTRVIASRDTNTLSSFRGQKKKTLQKKGLQAALNGR